MSLSPAALRSSLFSMKGGAVSLIAKGSLLLLAGAVGTIAITEGASATLDAIAANSAAHSVTDGTLILNAPIYPGSAGVGSSAGFNTAIDKVVPGDVMHRFVKYTNSGTLGGGDLSLWIHDSVGSVMTTNATQGLHVSVTACDQAWTWIGNEAAQCGGSSSVLATNQPLSGITDEANKTTFAGTSLAAGVSTYLKFDIALPDRYERRANAGTPTNRDGSALADPTVTMQGLNAQITWTIYTAARAATDTNG